MKTAGAEAGSRDAAEAMAGKGVQSCQELEGSICRVVRQYSAVFEFPIFGHLVPNILQTLERSCLALYGKYLLTCLLWHKGLGS